MLKSCYDHECLEHHQLGECLLAIHMRFQPALEGDNHKNGIDRGNQFKCLELTESVSTYFREEWHPYPNFCESWLGRSAAVNSCGFGDLLDDDEDCVDDDVEEDCSPCSLRIPISYY